LQLTSETSPTDVMTKSDFSANSDGCFFDSACEESDLDVNLNNGSLQSSVYEKRFSKLCATDDVIIYRAPSRNRISMLNKNR
ncbi:hypothetical protein FHG87_020379, partial [Trinorchestia longiramus]